MPDATITLPPSETSKKTRKNQTPLHLRLAVDINGLCELLSMSRSTVYSLYSSGRLPEGAKVGGKRFWSVAEIEAWVTAGMPPRSVWLARKATGAMNSQLNALREKKSA